MDLALLALAKGYTDKQIEKAEMGDIQLDHSLTKEGFAADAKAVGEALKNVNTSERTQANWEQNDETAEDFIKNRTHYKAQIDVTIIENKTVEFNVTSVGETSWTGTADIKIDKEMPAPIAENHIITAIINDVEWTAPVEYNSDKDIMHAKIYDGASDMLDILFDQRNIEYPILRRISIRHQGETPFDYNNFTLSLYISGASVIQIPLEYIPVDQSPNHPISRQKVVTMMNSISERIPSSYYDLNDIPCYVKDSEKKSLAYFYFDHDSRLSVNEGDWYMSQYTHFEINGQLYPRKQYHTDQYGEMRYYYCGNGALIDDTGIAELEDTGEDFVIYANAEFKGCTAYYSGELDGEYTLSLKGVIPEEVKELDERCIPDTIARVSEIPDPSNVYIGEQEPIDENIELWLDPTAETRQPIYPPATATIGQTIVVKAVDENGVPTEWEAVDLPSGDIFYVNITPTGENTATSDKTFAEITEAKKNNKIVQCKYAQFILPLCWLDDVHAIFGGATGNVTICISVDQNNGVQVQTSTLAIESQVPTKEEFNTLKNSVSAIDNTIGAGTPFVASAAVGQTVVVKAVDENGVPIEWEAVDLASGGGSVSALDWEYINTLSFVKDDGVASLYCSETADGNPFEYDEILIMNPFSDYGGNANIWCNRETMYFTDCAQIKSFLAFGNKKYCLLKTLIYADGAQWILAESTLNYPVLYNISSAEKREDGKITSVCVAKSNTSDNAQATLQFYGRNYK